MMQTLVLMDFFGPKQSESAYFRKNLLQFGTKTVLEAMIAVELTI